MTILDVPPPDPIRIITETPVGIVGLILIGIVIVAIVMFRKVSAKATANYQQPLLGAAEPASTESPAQDVPDEDAERPEQDERPSAE